MGATTDTRERMIKSAALLLRERGVAGTSIAKVLEHSNGPRGSVAFHFPGGRAEMFTEAATPFTQQRYTRTTQGSAYGIEYAGRDFGPLRPGPATDVRGLFMAGCSGRWGPAVEGSMISGMNAAGSVLGRRFGVELRDGAVLGDPARLSTLDADWDPVPASKRPRRSPAATR